ncbi:oxygen-independent coproporphyrinogen III oxidase [Alteromonas sp. CYL-A6]|uniref:oxygen-independent coproporphyrinogen III oxidase n=1 Tax=Alteromonas nitratireducens TaxID=3390813 RepID=UPI0034AB468D
MTTTDLFDPLLLNKYNISGPRYTSYPTAPAFSDNIPATLLADAAATSARDLSLYIHIPFCHSLCYYCGCSKIITRHQDKADRYLDYLEIEIQRRAPAFKNKTVREIHLGGGSPSFLTQAQHTRLRDMLFSHFSVARKPQMSVEIDPRRFEKADLSHLFALGYNRLSIGVQDVDYQVQQAINRVQSTAHIAALIDHARLLGFSSINIDLIYGLPHQTPETFRQTLSATKAMTPDRVSLFSYAHLPSRFAAQRKIRDEWLPGPADKLALMKQAIESLTDYGYIMVGMDHFALPDDDLAKARQAGQLHRNFQGYTTGAELDLLGLGVTAISAMGNTYGQNPKDLNTYYRILDEQGQLTEKGICLSQDDLIRRDVIMALMCNLTVDFSDIEGRYGIDFSAYFRDELEQLAPFVKDEVLHFDEQRIVVEEKARLFIRIIAMTFDAYLNQHQHVTRYSRVI